MIPFTIDQFMQVFERYNNAIWPGHALIYLAGLTAIALAFKHGEVRSKLISLILAALWLWMGVVYHLIFFSTINKAARLFGALFIVQSLIFIFAGMSSKLSFRFSLNVQGILGAMLIAYALILYPIIGMFYGHIYPAAATFGVPCPTTIFTFGLLLGAGINIRLYTLIIPVLWSLMGLWAALSLGMYEDLGLAVAGLSTVWNVLQHRRESTPPIWNADGGTSRSHLSTHRDVPPSFTTHDPQGPNSFMDQIGGGTPVR